MYQHNSYHQFLTACQALFKLTQASEYKAFLVLVLQMRQLGCREMQYLVHSDSLWEAEPASDPASQLQSWRFQSSGCSSAGQLRKSTDTSSLMEGTGRETRGHRKGLVPSPKPLRKRSLAQTVRSAWWWIRSPLYSHSAYGLPYQLLTRQISVTMRHKWFGRGSAGPHSRQVASSGARLPRAGAGVIQLRSNKPGACLPWCPAGFCLFPLVAQKLITKIPAAHPKYYLPTWQKM